MFRYRIRLFPVRAVGTPVDLTPTLPRVQRAAEEFTLRGMRAANRKRIDVNSINIQRDMISLELYSDAWLGTPVKAIRSFISSLAREPEYRELITSSGRLFKGDSEEINEPEEPEELSDEQALIRVVQLFCRDSRESRIKIDEIKTILVRNTEQ